jgi:hypothetical protein
MTSAQIIEIACYVSGTTPRQVIERKTSTANINVRALICYLLRKHLNMHTVLIGELLNRPNSDILKILRVIEDSKDFILLPRMIKLYDMMDQADRIITDEKQN